MIDWTSCGTQSPGQPPCNSNSCEQYRALLEVTRAITSHRDFSSLMEALTALLRVVVPFDYLSLLLYEPESDGFFVFYPGLPKKPIFRSGGFGFDDGPSGWAWHHQQSIVCDIDEIATRFPRIAARRREQDIVSCAVVPLTTSVRRVGALEFLSTHPGAYREQDIHFMEQVGSQVAVAVDNTLHHESARAYQEKIETLLNVTNAVVSSLDLNGLLEAVSQTIEHSLGACFTSLVLHDPTTNTLKWEATRHPFRKSLIKPGRTIPLNDSPVAVAFQTARPIALPNDVLLARVPDSKHVAQLVEEGIRAVCCIPMIVKGRTIGLLNVGHLEADNFPEQEVQMLSDIANQIAVSVENARAYIEISQLKDQLSREKLYLEEEIRTAYNFEQIIGESAPLKSVLAQIEMVAASDATVLILGETGTGKELVARAIHDLSPRSSRTLMKLNCAAIPTGLLESDLFGHEKGAFTGATNQKVGRFELAHKGTLFLDEIGDMPLELQPKLLRAIQEGEIERLGGTRSIKVDVRLIAATHRNLEQMLIDGKFRSDLYYRLNVFPIILPALRERVEDIPLLTRHFAQKYAKRFGKHIDCIPSETMEALMRLPWPGNIRELENLIERAVIISKGPVLQVPVPEPAPISNRLSYSSRFRVPSLLNEDQPEDDTAERDVIMKALRETNGCIAGPSGAAEMLGMTRGAMLSALQRLRISVYPEGVGSEERDLILRALRDSNGKIAGPRGAAARLGLNRTTLYSRMQRLGIPKNL